MAIPAMPMALYAQRYAFVLQAKVSSDQNTSQYDPAVSMMGASKNMITVAKQPCTDAASI